MPLEYFGAFSEFLQHLMHTSVNQLIFHIMFLNFTLPPDTPELGLANYDLWMKFGLLT